MNAERQCKIAFTGSSGVGKTTTFEAVRERFPDAAFVKEAARDFFATNTVSDRFSAETQGRIQAITLKNEKIAHESGAAIIFCDRSVLDAVIYTREHGNSGGAEELFGRIQFWLPTYDHFLLLDPADIPYQQDEIRQESEEKRNSFHRVFVEFFEEKGIPYELLSGTIEERMKRIEDLLFLAKEAAKALYPKG